MESNQRRMLVPQLIALRMVEDVFKRQGGLFYVGSNCFHILKFNEHFAVIRLSFLKTMVLKQTQIKEIIAQCHSSSQINAVTYRC